MKILVINGSPRKEKSNTLRVTRAFLEGMSWEEKCDVEILHAIDLNVKYCKGCYSCWTYTPGRCVIKDDMAEIMEKYLAADVVIFSTPVHTFGVSAPLKTVMDRLIPVSLPIIEERKIENKVTVIHPSRYDVAHQRYILISTCGFYSYENNVEPIEKQFEIMYGDALTKIICPEGELFSIPQLNYRLRKYLDTAKRAGKEFAREKRVSQKTMDKLRVKHYDPESFTTLANCNWQVREENMSDEEFLHARAKNYVTQMAIIYESDFLSVPKVIMEMEFTDSNYHCQMVMTKEGCEVVEDPARFEKYTLKVICKLNAWIKLSRDKVTVAGGAMGTAPEQSSEYKVITEWMSALEKKGQQKILRL